MAARRAAAAHFFAVLLIGAGPRQVAADGGAASAPQAPTSATVPCATPEFHQFDFWIGEWEVTTLDGKLAGWNVIQRDLGGCVLTESWTGARGGRGRSLNIYTVSDGHWHQEWVDSRGQLLQLTGGLQDGDMVLSGETVDAKGAKLVNRITWHRVDDDHVRQHWQQSSDGGATWTDAFLGLYARKKI
jgi:hypothetical protein